MRFIYGQGWVHVQAPEGEDGGGGGAADGGGEGAGGEDGASAPEGGEAGGEAPAPDGSEGGHGDPGALPDGEVPADGGGAGDGDQGEAPAASMLDAINKGLGYKKDEAKPPVDKTKAAQPPADKAKQSPAQPPKPKTSAELELKPEELKGLGPKAQQRFREVIGTVKAHEATIARVSDENKQLSAARDSLFSAMDDAQMTKEDLGGYLEFHAMMTSQDPKQLESALKIVTDQRNAIMAALGRDGEGFDALDGFDDLRKAVEDETISRAHAVEVAASRRAKASAQKTAEQAQQRKQQEGEQQRANAAAATKALDDIKGWVQELERSDLDYKAKEGMLLEAQGDQPSKLKQVMKDYPPAQWLPTLKLLYQGIKVQRAAAPGKSTTPLRPSGVRPGGKSPTSMKEAIDQGLGYAKG